jgi:Fe-S-cluster-containing dehydrogenase component
LKLRNGRAKSLAKYGMIVDIGKCNGCYNCFLSCRDEYAGNDYPPYSAAQPTHGQYWMQVGEKERGSYPKVKVSYIPLPCLHCEEAPCITSSPGNAVYRRPDGIVLIDPEKAAGKKEIANKCPHRVIYWNVHKKIPQKCTFCAHLLDEGWKVPRCVEACPTGALTFGDLDDPDSDLVRLMNSGEIEELHPEYGLKPRVVYKGLPKRYIAGEIVLDDRRGECAEGVLVTLIGGDEETTIKTDNYGDFEFDGLVPHNSYRIRIEHEGYASKEIAVQTRLDVNIGEIVLESK